MRKPMDLNVSWKRHDYRKESLHQTIIGLKNSIEYLNEKLKEISWYDGIWLLEESEPILGIAYIAFQNYINSSIFDKEDTLERKISFYKKGQFLDNYEHTQIELIIALANYFKHRDDDKSLHKGTTSILENFHLEYGSKVDIEDSPIFKGLLLLSKEWDLLEIFSIVINWREKLWE
jgi:hypothetical protein